MATSKMRFEDILRQGVTMLQTVENEQWERLVELQANRQELLESYFTSENLSYESRRQTIRQLVAFNQRLIEVVIAKRARLAQDLKEFSVGRQALQAYQQCDN